MATTQGSSSGVIKVDHDVAIIRAPRAGQRIVAPGGGFIQNHDAAEVTITLTFVRGNRRAARAVTIAAGATWTPDVMVFGVGESLRAQVTSGSPSVLPDFDLAYLDQT